MNPKPKNLDEISKIPVETAIALIFQDIGYIKTDVGEIKALVKNNYVTKDEFDPVKKIAYGVVSVILIGVLGAILTIVINNGGI